MNLPGDKQTALDALKRFPDLDAVIDDAKFGNKIDQKYPNGPTLNPGELIDLYTALLLIDSPLMDQNSNNAATPKGLIANVDRVLKTVAFSDADKKEIGTKLLNLKTSSLFDTSAEILTLQTMLLNVSPEKVGFEVPFGIPAAGHTQKDADFAILDDDGKPAVLIDAITPQRKENEDGAMANLEKIIAKKYDKKFSNYCLQNPDARVVILVCLLENEEWLVELQLPHVLIDPTYVANINSTLLDSKPGLVFAFACTFRSPSGDNLVIHHVAKYSRS